MFFGSGVEFEESGSDVIVRFRGGYRLKLTAHAPYRHSDLSIIRLYTGFWSLSSSVKCRVNWTFGLYDRVTVEKAESEELVRKLGELWLVTIDKAGIYNDFMRQDPNPARGLAHMWLDQTQDFARSLQNFSASA